MASHYSDYDPATTGMCERVLLTLIGDIGPWGKWITLVGGLAPRYIVGALPPGVTHIGTTDIDVVLQLSLGQFEPEAYKTLESNLRRSNFDPGDSSFQWNRRIDRFEIVLEFLCETDQVEPGRIFKPKGQKAGNALGAVNIPGASLASEDASTHRLTGERLDGGQSEVDLRVTNLLPFVALKILAFQDRHEGKDAYDLVFCLIQHADGPTGAAAVAGKSPVLDHETVSGALDLLQSRFRDVDQDGPHAYAAFLGDRGDEEGLARLRRDAHSAVQAFMNELNRIRGR